MPTNAELFEQFEPIALKIAWGFRNIRTHDLSDLHQEARLALLEVLPRIDPGNDSVAGYIAITVRNRLRKLYHRSHPHIAVDSLDVEVFDGAEGDQVLTLGDTIADTRPDPEQQTSDEQERELLARALDGLDSDDRELLTLSYGLGDEAPLSVREIAARTSRSKSSVARRLTTLITQIRTLIYGDAYLA